MKYLSAEQYSKQTGLGVAEVKRQCQLGTLESFMTEGGHYKIKYEENEGVPLKQYETVLKENAKLKELFENIKKILV